MDTYWMLQAVQILRGRDDCYALPEGDFANALRAAGLQQWSGDLKDYLQLRPDVFCRVSPEALPKSPTAPCPAPALFRLTSLCSISRS